MSTNKTFVIKESKNGKIEAWSISPAECQSLMKLIEQNRYGEHIDIHMNDFVSDLFIID